MLDVRIWFGVACEEAIEGGNLREHTSRVSRLMI